MKKNRVLLEISVLIGTISPFIIVYLLKGKIPFFEFDKCLKGTLIATLFSYFYPLFIYQNNTNRSFATKINLWFRLSWLSLSILFGGIFLLHIIFTSLNMTNKLFLILTGIMFMIEGNYRGLITKNSGIYMGIVDSISDEKIYKIAQQKIGRLEFWLGALFTTLSLIVPKIEGSFIYFIIIFNMILIFGISWIVYKSNKQVCSQ